MWHLRRDAISGARACRVVRDFKFQRQRPSTRDRHLELPKRCRFRRVLERGIRTEYELRGTRNASGGNHPPKKEKRTHRGFVRPTQVRWSLRRDQCSVTIYTRGRDRCSGALVVCSKYGLRVGACCPFPPAISTDRVERGEAGDLVNSKDTQQTCESDANRMKSKKGT